MKRLTRSERLDILVDEVTRIRRLSRRVQQLCKKEPTVASMVKTLRSMLADIDDGDEEKPQSR